MWCNLCGVRDVMQPMHAFYLRVTTKIDHPLILTELFQLVAKGLDIYIQKIHERNWDSDQSSTQFQGAGSSHELAAILLTECISYSKHTLKQPTFVLYLDAKSAFDNVLKELLIKNLYNVQELDQSLIIVNNRLHNRKIC